ncbi:hypothetical protein DFS34DRAFT_647841 [Phlyctochytrium arcticum]|nr:hypothetical protein DFS34DRAFT_647841 [Phlyctochytrium arcticum]
MNEISVQRPSPSTFGPHPHHLILGSSSTHEMPSSQQSAEALTLSSLADARLLQGFRTHYETHPIHVTHPATDTHALKNTTTDFTDAHRQSFSSESGSSPNSLSDVTIPSGALNIVADDVFNAAALLFNTKRFHDEGHQQQQKQQQQQLLLQESEAAKQNAGATHVRPAYLPIPIVDDDAYGPAQRIAEFLLEEQRKLALPGGGGVDIDAVPNISPRSLDSRMSHFLPSHSDDEGDSHGNVSRGPGTEPISEDEQQTDKEESDDDETEDEEEMEPPSLSALFGRQYNAKYSKSLETRSQFSSPPSSPHHTQIHLNAPAASPSNRPFRKSRLKRTFALDSDDDGGIEARTGSDRAYRGGHGYSATSHTAAQQRRRPAAGASGRRTGTQERQRQREQRDAQRAKDEDHDSDETVDIINNEVSEPEADSGHYSDGPLSKKRKATNRARAAPASARNKKPKSQGASSPRKRAKRSDATQSDASTINSPDRPASDTALSPKLQSHITDSPLPAIRRRTPSPKVRKTPYTPSPARQGNAAGIGSSSSAAAAAARLDRKTSKSCGRRCGYCHATQTPMWRHGPPGYTDLCNKCGVKWMRGRILQEPTPATPEQQSE